MMSAIKQLLLEFQSKNYLYHFTSYNALRSIMKEDKLRVGGTNIALQIHGKSYHAIRVKQSELMKKGYGHLRGISFTRNRQLYWDEYAIVVDRDKLKSNHKIYPLSVTGADYGKDSFKEEVVLKDINNISNYIEFIYIRNDSRITNVFGDRIELDHTLQKKINKLLKISEVVRNDIDIKLFHKGNFISVFELMDKDDLKIY